MDWGASRPLEAPSPAVPWAWGCFCVCSIIIFLFVLVELIGLLVKKEKVGRFFAATALLFVLGLVGCCQMPTGMRGSGLHVM